MDRYSIALGKKPPPEEIKKESLYKDIMNGSGFKMGSTYFVSPGTYSNLNDNYVVGIDPSSSNSSTSTFTMSTNGINIVSSPMIPDGTAYIITPDMMQDIRIKWEDKNGPI